MANASVSIVAPCFNEKENIEPLIKKLQSILKNLDWELILVDDNSPDATASHARSLIHLNEYPNIRVIQRLQERGLSSAVVWGVQAAHNDLVVVMDADLQHDETIIPAMLKEIERGAEVVVGSRFKGKDKDECVEGLNSRLRQNISTLGNRFLRLLLRTDLTDPLSGFFAVRRQDFARIIPKINGYGFKILFEVIYYLKPTEIVEIPFNFQTRLHGESKLQPIIFFDLACDFISKIFLSVLPPRLVGFLIVGSIGAIIHFSVFYTMLLFSDFMLAQIMGTSTAMVFNFSLNNNLTYREHKLKGFRFILGIIVYALASLVGIAANVGLAVYLFKEILNNKFLSSAAGVVIDVLWRYAIANNIWKRWIGRNNGQ